MKVSDLEIEVVRKDIKNLHLGVYPPAGRVRVAAPFLTSDDNIRLAIISKLSWIRKHQSAFAEQARQSEREYVSGENHYVFGAPHILEVVIRPGKHELIKVKVKRLRLFVKADTKRENRRKVVEHWYREQLEMEVFRLLEKWKKKIGCAPSRIRYRRMKTKWGSCNPKTKIILLNTELAKKPIECVEYILVHELVHLLEPKHNARFFALMDRFLPQWRRYKSILNGLPISDESS